MIADLIKPKEALTGSVTKVSCTFSERVLRWWRKHGRKDLPWQKDVTPYRVWVSEIMLQQTQVGTVIPYFERFMQRFPDVGHLAAASLDDVLHLWTGLGYYARARHMHRTAQKIVAEYGGQMPSSVQELCALPGIGRSTAGAILSLAYKQPHAILDGNVKRVLCRYHGIREWPGAAATERRLWALAETHLPVSEESAAYTQAMMDLGSLVCRRAKPLCQNCPLRSDCVAYREGKTAEWPMPRPRRSLPEKEVWFIVLKDYEGRVLLEQREPTGVWGGLWSFPMIESAQTAAAWINRELGKTENYRSLADIQHVFSHFRLHIHPLLIELQTPLATGVKDEPRVWYKPGQSPPGGLAAPVVRLIRDLTNV